MIPPLFRPGFPEARDNPAPVHTHMDTYEHQYNHGHAGMHKAPYYEAFLTETQPREIHGLGDAHTAHNNKGESDKQ